MNFKFDDFLSYEIHVCEILNDLMTHAKNLLSITYLPERWSEPEKLHRLVCLRFYYIGTRFYTNGIGGLNQFSSLCTHDGWRFHVKAGSRRGVSLLDAANLSERISRLYCSKNKKRHHGVVETPTSCTQNRNHTTRPMVLVRKIQ